VPPAPAGWQKADESPGPRLSREDEERMQDAMALQAYVEAPGACPVGYLLLPREREDLADDVGRALLALSGKPPRSPLEMLARQTAACLELGRGCGRPEMALADDLHALGYNTDPGGDVRSGPDVDMEGG